jgi:hypothetical protein
VDLPEDMALLGEPHLADMVLQGVAHPADMALRAATRRVDMVLRGAARRWVGRRDMALRGMGRLGAMAAPPKDTDLPVASGHPEAL